MGRGCPAQHGLAKTAVTTTAKRNFTAGTLWRPTAEYLSRLCALAGQGSITVVFLAHDEIHNDAIALRSCRLERQTKRKFETLIDKRLRLRGRLSL